MRAFASARRRHNMSLRHLGASFFIPHGEFRLRRRLQSPDQPQEQPYMVVRLREVITSITLHSLERMRRRDQFE
jgi:hypothetical protein